MCAAKLVFSPSNLQTYRQCPLKFYGQSISRELKWKPSPQKTRGTLMHEEMERLLRQGWQDNNTFDSQIDTGYAASIVNRVRKMMADGYALFVEREMCVTKQGAVVDWWNDKAFLRAKADVVLVHPDPEKPILVGDIKTGRNWGDDFQCRVECLLAHIMYKKPMTVFEYWYIDQGETEEGVIDFRNGLAPVQDVFDLMADARQAIKNSYFPPVANFFCRWCQWHQTDKCNGGTK